MYADFVISNVALVAIPSYYSGDDSVALGTVLANPPPTPLASPPPPWHTHTHTSLDFGPHKYLSRDYRHLTSLTN